MTTDDLIMRWEYARDIEDDNGHTLTKVIVDALIERCQELEEALRETHGHHVLTRQAIGGKE